VLYQSKILTTGLLMVLLLGRSFSVQKWAAMVLLLFGIVLTQYSPGAGKAVLGENRATGLVAVFACSLSSSVAGVVMEKYMKDGSAPGGSAAPPGHLSTKNIHLSFFSMLLVGIPVAFRVWTGVEPSFPGVLHGVDGVVWAMILNQAFGGILVALALRHADNILKTFATTSAIVVGGLASHVMFGFVPTAPFVAGSFTVGVAMVLYGPLCSCCSNPK
jgi:solute carrier family 35 (UDP-sugar transporter), member A1/2/3